MLDKKELRPFAVPNLALDPNNGLLYACQVDYIVCTDVQDIGNQPVLILHFLPREQAAIGDFRPVCTMFQTKGEYITMDRDGGKSKWRTAAFEKLFHDNSLGQSCAFFSAQDERRVSSYFRDEGTPGFAALIKAQDAYMAARKKANQVKKERKILARMEGIPTLPDGLEDWAYRHILPGYFFYNHSKKGIATGVCSVCDEEITLENVKHNGEAVCPHCGRELTMKPRGRVKRLYDRETFQVVQRGPAPGELVIRICKAAAAYEGDGPVVYVNVREAARLFVGIGPDGNMVQERFYRSYQGELTDWKEGDRPTNMGYVTFEGETCGHLYCGNLPAALEGTPWQYCPVVEFYQHHKKRLELSTFFGKYLKHPRLEHLIKTGFFSLAADMVYNYYIYEGRVDETQNRTHRILGVMAEDVPFLRELDINSEGLKVYQKYCVMNLKDRQRLLLWQAENGVRHNVMPALEHMTAHKLMKYMDGQFLLLRGQKTPSGGQRYKAMQDVVTEYKDYLEMCVEQRYDMKNSFILYPADLQKSHDKVARRIQVKADAKMRRDFKAAYQRIMGQLDFEQDGMRIVYPTSLDEIIAEGNALHHCVANYVDKVAKQKTMILFLRKSEDVDKPFYTVEVAHRKVAQVRGNGNAAPTPEVQKFMDVWEQQVLRGRDVELEAAA